MTSAGRPASLGRSASRRWCSGEYGSIRPSSGTPGATDARHGGTHAAAGEHDRARRLERSSALLGAQVDERARGGSSEATISANGLSSRCFRRRSADTTASSSARHARWYPPMPLTATIAPSQQRRGGRPHRVGVGRRRRRPSGRTASRRARTRGRRSAGRGSGGRPDRRTRPCNAGTSEPGHRRERPVVRDARGRS